MRTIEPGQEVLEDPPATADPGAGGVDRRGRRRIRRLAMRPRRVLVKLHRWLAVGLMAWLVVISLTGAWLVESDALESLAAPGDRYTSTAGDVGPDRAIEAADADAARTPPTSTASPCPRTDAACTRWAPRSRAPAHARVGEPTYTYHEVFVDPGYRRRERARTDEEAGFTWWLYRGHMYLWQDHGIFGVFDPETRGGAARGRGAEPGGVKGVVCDVIPDGEDMVAWLGVGFIVVLFIGFYLWYWPGVKPLGQRAAGATRARTVHVQHVAPQG